MDLQDLLDQGYTSEMDVDELEFRIAEKNEHPVIQYVKMFPFEEMYFNPDDVPLNEIPELLSWVPPGHDLDRPKRLHCGPVRIKGTPERRDAYSHHASTPGTTTSKGRTTTAGRPNAQCA